MKKMMMMIMFAGCGLLASTARADDPWAVARFGSTNSPLIWSGYVFIDGKYVDAPYEVQQHGYGIFINGTYLNEGIWRLNVFPPTNRATVTFDPGAPTNFVATNTFADVWADSFTIQKVDYWHGQNIRGSNLLSAATNFFASCGCFTQVTVTVIGQDWWELVVCDHTGGAGQHIMLPFSDWSLPARPATPGDAALTTNALIQWQSFQRDLKQGRSLWANGGGVTENGPAPSSNLVAILRLTNSPTKLSQLQALGELVAAIGDSTNVEIGLGHILTAFTASTQLEQRVSGDMSWTNYVPSSIPQPSP